MGCALIGRCLPFPRVSWGSGIWEQEHTYSTFSSDPATCPAADPVAGLSVLPGPRASRLRRGSSRRPVCPPPHPALLGRGSLTAASLSLAVHGAVASQVTPTGASGRLVVFSGREFEPRGGGGDDLNEKIKAERKEEMPPANKHRGEKEETGRCHKAVGFGGRAQSGGRGTAQRTAGIPRGSCV